MRKGTLFLEVELREDNGCRGNGRALHIFYRPSFKHDAGREMDSLVTIGENADRIKRLPGNNISH